MNIFSNIKIIDLSRVFSGPFATRHFADFGAEVIKIEPLEGDDSRRFPPIIKNWSGYFEILNRNKKSIVLNLKDRKDLLRFYKLCKDTDVIVENFTPSTKKRLKIDYNQIKNFNQNIIYASISGISQNVDKKYYDIIAQAESGFMSLNGIDEDVKVAPSIIDAFSGMKLAFAISSALYERSKTGRGCQIDVSMKGSAFDLLEQNMIATSTTGQNPLKVGNMDNAIAPFGIFKTKDGSIALAIGNNSQWQIFAQFISQNNNHFNIKQFLAYELRLINIHSLVLEIEKVSSQFETDEIIKLCHKMNIPCGKVNKMTDIICDKENYQENLLKKIKHPVAGNITVPTGGITFSNHDKEPYQFAPELNQNIDYGI